MPLLTRMTAEPEEQKVKRQRRNPGMFWLVKRIIRIFHTPHGQTGLQGHSFLLRHSAVFETGPEGTVSEGIGWVLIFHVLSVIASTILGLLFAIPFGVVNGEPSYWMMSLILALATYIVIVFFFLRYGPGAYLAQIPAELRHQNRGRYGNGVGAHYAFHSANRWKNTFSLIARGISPKDFGVFAVIHGEQELLDLIENRGN